MKRLIVTADDFGLTPGVVSGIVDAHERGIVTATSLMVNAPATESAAAWAAKHEVLAVGLHFVLTFGRPVGPPARLGRWLAPDGTFRRPREGRPEPVGSGTAESGIRGELRAQLERFERLVGRPPTHLDGHHHVHLDPGVLPAVLEESGRLRIPVRSLDEATRSAVRGSGVATADHFIASFYGSGNVDVAALSALLRDLPDGTSELMCHPARQDAILPTLSSYSTPRYEELESLTSPRAREALAANGIELCPGA